jgi:AraC-like DNA-binding protein
MIIVLEQSAHGDSVSNVAHAVGYETPSSSIAAFRASFGTSRLLTSRIHHIVALEAPR